MRNFEVAKKKAFTLSEILIVLAIIGFVASVILGVIKINSNKQFVAGRSMFANDFATALAAMNVEVPLKSFNDTKTFFNKLSEYFEVYTQSPHKDEFFAVDKMKDKSGNVLVMEDYEQYFVTKNGISVALNYVKKDVDIERFVPDVSTIEEGDEGYKILNDALAFVKGMYDLNGPKGPNVLGRDIGYIGYDADFPERGVEEFASIDPGTPISSFVPNINSEKCKNAPSSCPNDYTWAYDGNGCLKCIAPDKPDTDCVGDECGKCTGDNCGTDPIIDDPEPEKCKNEIKSCQKGYTWSAGSDGCGLCTKDKDPEPVPVCEKNVKKEDCSKSQNWSAGSDGCGQCTCKKTTLKADCKANEKWSKGSDGCGTCTKCSEPKCTGNYKLKNGGTCNAYCYCPTDVKTNCEKTGGTFIASNCSCTCTKVDTGDTCGFKVAVQENGKCIKKCQATSSKFPKDKATFYTVLKGEQYTNCFKCQKTANNKYVKLTQNTCGCGVSCTNGDDYTKQAENKEKGIGQVKFDAIKSKSADSCIWSCKSVSKPSKCSSGETFTCAWKGLSKDKNEICRWKESCTKKAIHPSNSNYKLNTTTCEYKCDKPNKPNSSSYWKYQEPSKASYVYKDVPTDKCIYKCDVSALEAAAKKCASGDYSIDKNSCTYTCECKLNQKVCENIAKTCISPASNSTQSSCTQAHRIKLTLYDKYSDTKTYNPCRCATAHNSSGEYYRPWGTGFGTYYGSSSKNKMNYNSCSGGYCCAAYVNGCSSKTKSYLRYKATNYITCDTSVDRGIEAKFDAGSCKCKIKVYNSDSIDSVGNRVKPGKTYTYEYEGWNHVKDTSGNVIENHWKGYHCTYSETKSTTFSIKSGSVSLKDGSSKTCKWYNDNGKIVNNGSSYVSKLSESCTSFDDPMMLVIQENKKASDVASKFSMDKTLAIEGTEGIYWMSGQDEKEPSYLFLVKKNAIEDGKKVTNDLGDLKSWEQIQKIMFTDLAYSNGIEELREYASLGNSQYLNTQNPNWNELALMLVNNSAENNFAKTKIYELGDFKITEIFLKSFRNNITRSNDAGAIGTLEGCYRRGIEVNSIPKDAWERKVINNQVQYCKIVNGEEKCVLESSKGTDKYTYKNGECAFNTLYDGKPGATYFIENGKIYVEKALPFADILFKSRPENSDGDEELQPEEETEELNETPYEEDVN